MSRSLRIHQQGFTYLGLLFFIAVMSIALSLAATLWSFAQQRERERELLFVGHQFRQAIKQYYESTPGTIKRYPARLQDLLQDNRYVYTRRYLRRIYRDPLTLEASWGMVPAPEGGIMGVYSLNNTSPIKTENFKEADKDFVQAKKYSEWRFIFVPPLTGTGRVD